MIQDLHSHTYYSFCGADRPEEVVEAAIAGGIELLGICDHNYGMGFGRTDVFFNQSDKLKDGYERALRRYFDHINLIKEKYAGKIQILRGIEISTNEKWFRSRLPESEDVSFFDYCLVEHLGNEDSMLGGDIVSFAKRCACPTGVAHTDIFSFCERECIDPLDYFKRMADAGVFWEMNVNFDSIHNYRKHGYVDKFFSDEEQQEIIRKSGVRLSVGFDGHKCGEYRADIVKDYCGKIEALGIPMAFDSEK